ncbi:MAG: glycerate kinase [Oscillospiraceae bacterium]|nr:glycerate kinase [Oscillospiraceae bacterium]
MKKIIIIPDSFKGTLSSKEICDITASRILAHFPDCDAVSIPVADGGEGSVDCFLAAVGGESVSVRVKGPFFEELDARYAVIENGKTAVIEMAAAAGLPLAGERKDPLVTTTYGVGQLMLDAMKRGCPKIILGLGGSCTNDAGTGAAAAVGVRFLDRGGNAFVPVGGTLSDVKSIDVSGKSRLLDSVEIVVMCDIENPLYGESGAAYVFAPQKGADSVVVAALDVGLRHIAAVIRRDLHTDVSVLKGGGAAGGMGAGMAAFFGSELKAGIEVVLDAAGFDGAARGADLVITGEGRLDSQSLGGKAVIGVARRAKRLNVPVVAVVGGCDYGLGEVYGEGVSCVFTTNRLAEDFSVSRYRARENLAETVDNIMRLLKIKNAN